MCECVCVCGGGEEYNINYMWCCIEMYLDKLGEEGIQRLRHKELRIKQL